MFCGNEIRRHDEIWARFKSQLGADSEDRWRKLASVVLQNSEKKGGKICAIRLAGYRSLPAPIDPKDAGIDINSQMQKGHNLTRAEVDALLGTISPVLVYGREDQIPTLAQLDDELEAAVNESSQGDPDARQERLQRAPTFPKKLTVTSVAFRRNPDVIAEVLERAKGRCELCEQDAPFLRASDGSPYLEVHHRRPLGEGGEDTVENGQALCPNCHREVHYG
ncbi:MAG: HNH endonuclease [bacterium]|nr:HNH endonuclease [bacterium]